MPQHYFLLSECKENNDCADGKMCAEDGECISPVCEENCSELYANSTCGSTNHTAKCVCLEEYFGDPESTDCQGKPRKVYM